MDQLVLALMAQNTAESIRRERKARVTRAYKRTESALLFRSVTVVQILEEAREYVASGWNTTSMARDDVQTAVRPQAGTAVCWCAIGSLKRVLSDHKQPVALDEKGSKGRAALEALKAVLPGDFRGNVAKWNDAPGRTQEQVLALFDRAIRRLATTQTSAVVLTTSSDEELNEAFTVETRKTHRRPGTTGEGT